MLAFIRARCEARHLARHMRESMAEHRCEWCLSACGLTHGEFRIELVPRRFRIFDAVHVYFRKTEVWMPLIQRIRLRAHARWVIATRAHYNWNEAHSCDGSGDCGACSTVA
jgi:hypothetical protein